MDNKNSYDIAESMAQLLTPTYIEKKASSNSTTEAMENLVKAAEIFENLEMFVAAEAVTDILERIPKKIEE